MGCCNSEFHALCDRQTTVCDHLVPSSTIYVCVCVMTMLELVGIVLEP